MGYTRYSLKTELSSSPVGCLTAIRYKIILTLICSSDPNWEFSVVHNGIITNYKELKALLESKGFKFETETDTEAIAKLAKFIYDSHRAIYSSQRHLV